MQTKQLLILLGVTTNGTPGQAGAYTQIVVASGGSHTTLSMFRLMVE